MIADLPEKTEVKAFCALTKRQAALYEESVEALAREVASVAPGIGCGGAASSSPTSAAEADLQPPLPVARGWRHDAPVESGKFSRLGEMPRSSPRARRRRWSSPSFARSAEPLARYLGGAFGRPGLILTGETRVKERSELVRRFQEDESIPFFVLSLKAGGTGLNLTAATHVIHFDRWWNPAVENQATDRAFRIGQKRGVLVHKLVLPGTMQERIDAMLEEKQNLSRDLLEGGGEVRLTELDDRELLRLVSLDLRSATSDT